MTITGKEKAFLGGLGAGLTTFAGQLSLSGKVDVKTVAWSLGAWLATHLFVYYTTNSTIAQTTIQDAVAAAEKSADLATPTS